MINANELRIGNYIHYTKQNVNVEIGWYNFEALVKHPEWYEPISLTEGILLKARFEKNEWESIDKKHKGVDYFMDEFSIRVSLSDDVCKKGVHYFQNWYFFETGKELEINL